MSWDFCWLHFWSSFSYELLHTTGNSRISRRETMKSKWTEFSWVYPILVMGPLLCDLMSDCLLLIIYIFITGISFSLGFLHGNCSQEITWSNLKSFNTWAISGTAAQLLWHWSPPRPGTAEGTAACNCSRLWSSLCCPSADWFHCQEERERLKDTSDIQMPVRDKDGRVPSLLVEAWGSLAQTS